MTKIKTGPVACKPTGPKQATENQDNLFTTAEVAKKFKCDVNELIEKLKFFMAEKDLTIHDVAVLIKRDPVTVWQFLRQKVKPNERTIYKIKKLLGNH